MKTFIKILDYLLTIHIPVPELDRKADSRVKVIIRNYLRRNYLVRSLYPWDKMKSNRGLGVFLIKQYHPKSGITSKIIQYIQDCGFEIIKKKELTEDQKKYFQHNPLLAPHFWISDFPHYLVLVYDKNPIGLFKKIKDAKWKYWVPLKEKLIVQKGYYFRMFPSLDNLRLLIKYDLRIALNRLLPKELQDSYYVHSTDNYEESLEYVEKCFADSQADILDYISQKT